MTEESNDQKVIIEHHYDRPPKDIVIAYVLWFFLGSIGIHRFYTGRVGSGIAMMLLNVVGWITVWFVVGFVFFFVLGIWLFIDIFLIPGMCREPK